MGEARPDPNLGHLVEQQRPRDAVHIAIIPATAGERLQPGRPVEVFEGVARPAVGTDVLGVVDPFLQQDVQEGERFWLLLTPGTITSLRHEWTHPTFPLPLAPPAPWDAAAVAASDEWLREHARFWDISYDDLIDGAKHGDLCFGSESAEEQARYEAQALWYHLEVVTGQRFSPDHRDGTVFHCAC